MPWVSGLKIWGMNGCKQCAAPTGLRLCSPSKGYHFFASMELVKRSKLELKLHPCHADNTNTTSPNRV
jgi:hypothetical protein